MNQLLVVRDNESSPSPASRLPLSVIAPFMQGRPGITDPVVRAEDGNFYALKLSLRTQPCRAANEFLGSYLLEALGFPCPRFTPVCIDDATAQFLTGDPLMGDEYMIPADGVCCAVEFIANLEHDLRQWLPSAAVARIGNYDDFVGVYILDVWASHQAQRQCLYQLDSHTRIQKALFHENTRLFGGATWSEIGSHSLLPACAYLNLRNVKLSLIHQWVAYFSASIPPLLGPALQELKRKSNNAWYVGEISQLEKVLIARLNVLMDLMEDALYSYRI